MAPELTWILALFRASRQGSRGVPTATGLPLRVKSRHWGSCDLMSALPPKADMDQHGSDVRFVPKADIRRAVIRSTITMFTPCKRYIEQFLPVRRAIPR